MNDIGKFIIAIGIGLVFLGLIITVGGKFGFGKLPGDIYINKGNFKFFFPITSSIILSIVLSLLLKIFRKWR
jgi:uncharacterized membrane protein YjjP (DUF1212 family)